MWFMCQVEMVKTIILPVLVLSQNLFEQNAFEKNFEVFFFNNEGVASNVAVWLSVS